MQINDLLKLSEDKLTILSINESAGRLLDTGHESVGKNILTINRNMELQEILSKALAGETAQKVVAINEGYYQIEGSPVIADGAISGMALLIFNVTERKSDEKVKNLKIFLY